MRQHYSTIDNRTGRTLVLSDVSYNNALYWLQEEVAKFGKEIFRCESIDGTSTVISTGTPKHDFDFDGNRTKWYTNIVKFYYIEDRGVLLQE